MKLNEKLFDERKTKGLTQKAISLLLNVPEPTYGAWEQGRSEPSAQMLVRLADVFEVSTDYLLGRASEFNVVEINVDLTAQQKELLGNFEKLNAEGKARLLGYLLALLSMPAYVRK